AGEAIFAVSGTEGFGLPVAADWHDAGGVRMVERSLQDSTQDSWVDTGHVARQDQIPVRRRVGQGGFDAGERARMLTKVGDNGKTEAAVDVWRTDDGRAAGRVLECGGGNFHQSTVTQLKKCLIHTHTRAGASREQIPGCLHGTDDIIKGLDTLRYRRSV